MTKEMSKDAVEIATRKIGDVAIVDIKGDVTSVTACSIEEAYHELSAAGEKKILLCFVEEDYINSGGLAILIGMVSESKSEGQVIRVTGLSEHFVKIFDMVGLSRYTEIFPSEEEALEGF